MVSIDKDFQETAMLNRLDLRASLAKYQAAEAKLRLEIARQYPDITLSPSYSYEPDGKFWALGIGSLITLITKNKGLIAEASSLRDVEAAQINVTQAKIISEVNQAKAYYIKSFEAISRAEKLFESQATKMKQIEQQFNLGAADRLQLTNTKLEGIIALQNQLTSRYKFQMAQIALEDSLQKPLENKIRIEKAIPEN
jgi:outer membrane protein TolC